MGSFESVHSQRVVGSLPMFDRMIFRGHLLTRTVTIPLDVRATGAGVDVAGALTFPFSDFDMDPPNIAGFVTVESDPAPELRLVLAKEG